MMEKCLKGLPTEATFYKDLAAAVYDGHGVAVYRDRYCIAIGGLHMDSNTLIVSSGGTFVEQDDVIVHTPSYCREGIRRLAE